MGGFFLSIRGFFLAAALGAAVLAAGCGSSDSSSETSETSSEKPTPAKIVVETGSLSKSQFIEKADAICQEGTKEWEQRFGNYLKGRNTGKTKSEQEATAATIVNTIIIPTFEKEIERVSALGAPSGDEKQVTAVLVALQQGANEGSADPVAFISTAKTLTKASKLGQAYGFSSCGGP
jgi:hypothetical protein